MIKIGLNNTKYLIKEVLIIFGFIFLINNYIGTVEKTINADGIGYFDYLPSIFIHHDFLRKNDSEQENPKLYERINNTGVYVEYGEFKVNKYPCGTAILQLPFFTYANLITDLEVNDKDGYQNSFQRAIFFAAIFYLFLSILFLREILLLYNVKDSVILICQLIFVFATSVTHYANFDAGFSHIYSLFAITFFAFNAKLFFKKRKIRYFFFMCVALGLIFNLRNPNILVGLFIPFLAGSKDNLINGIKALLIQKSDLIIGFLIFFGIISTQLIAWYFQTGDFFVYSYQGEGFDFLRPHFYEMLFSYKKGLFIYSPFLLIASCSTIWFAYKREYYLLFSWLFFFVILTYILSSWWSWYYGCSYGSRVYIDYYVIFFIPFALTLNAVSIKMKFILIGLSFLTIPLNIIQTYQYKEYILHWIDMDKEKYWKVFLKTDDTFKGLVWKKDIDLNSDLVEKTASIGDFTIPKNTRKEVYIIKSKDVPNFDKINIIQVLIDDEFKEKDESKIIVKITNSNDCYYRHHVYLVHLHEKELNKWHTGLYNFEFTPITDNENKLITIELLAGKENKTYKNVRVKLFREN